MLNVAQSGREVDQATRVRKYMGHGSPGDKKTAFGITRYASGYARPFRRFARREPISAML